jgi:hypothetical protein
MPQSQEALVMNAQVAALGTQSARPSLLRNVLRADGSISLVAGIAAVIGAAWLAPEFGVPVVVIGVSAIVHAIYGAALLYLSGRELIQRRMVWMAIGLDVLWVVAAVILLVDNPLPLTSLARWLVAAGAVGVAVIADLKWFGLRQLRK